LSGLSFQDAELSIPAPTAGSAPTRLPTADCRLPRHPACRGAFLFTHFGVTGPAVFALCSLAAERAYGPDDPMPLRINLMPDTNEAQLDRLLQEHCAALGGRALVNVLDTLLPRSICPVLCELAGVAPSLHAA